MDARKPVAIINVGPTRADDMATLKIEARSGEVRDYTSVLESELI